MKKWAPVLKLSIAMLRLTASVVQVVTGLPIPLPDGQINNRTALNIVTGGVYCSKFLLRNILPSHTWCTLADNYV